MIVMEVNPEEICFRDSLWNQSCGIFGTMLGYGKAQLAEE
jgi:hypothetical protein